MTIEEIEAIEWDYQGTYDENVLRNEPNLEAIRLFIQDPDTLHEHKIRATKKLAELIPTLAAKSGIYGKQKPITDEELLEIVLEGYRRFYPHEPGT